MGWIDTFTARARGLSPTSTTSLSTLPTITSGIQDSQGTEADL